MLTERFGPDCRTARTAWAALIISITITTTMEGVTTIDALSG
jgi:hypothetical protein